MAVLALERGPAVQGNPVLVADVEDLAIELQWIDKLYVRDLPELEYALEVVGDNVVEWLRSYTKERRPPVVGSIAGDGWRPAHPGHWADITGDLAAAYEWNVSRYADTVSLTFANPMWYAKYLEARDAFYVLRGVEEPGGPLDRYLRALLPVLAPGWKVT